MDALDLFHVPQAIPNSLSSPHISAGVSTFRGMRLFA